MSEFTHEVSELTAHAGHIDSLGSAIDGIGGALGSLGVGSTSMYGILVGQVAHPVLSHVAHSKSTAITDLAAVLHSTAATLRTAAETYSDTEETASQRSRAVEHDINQIDVP